MTINLDFLGGEILGVSFSMLIAIAVKIIVVYLLIRIAKALVRLFISKATKREKHALDKTTICNRYWLLPFMLSACRLLLVISLAWRK